MVSQNFHQTHLQEVGLTQISGDHDKKNPPKMVCLIFSSMTYSTIDSKTNSLKFRHIVFNQILPSFFINKICNGPSTWSILTSHCLRANTTQNGFPMDKFDPLDENQG